jgi:hypothetical protein
MWNRAVSCGPSREQNAQGYIVDDVPGPCLTDFAKQAVYLNRWQTAVPENFP